MSKFFEIQPDKYIHSDQIVSVEMKVASYNPQGDPFKYEIATTLIDGRVVTSGMDHRVALEPKFNAMIAELNS